MNDARMPAVERRLILSNHLAVATYVLCAIAFVVLALKASHAPAFPVDIAIARQVQAIHSPGFEAVMQAVTRIGFFVPSAIIALGCALGFGVARRPVEAVFILLTATGDVVNEVAKLLVSRPRPSSDLVAVFEKLSEYSFPSAHVTHYVVFYGFIFFLFWSTVPRSWPRSLALTVTAALVLLIGPSRIALGAHWPSDVLGGYLLGGLWLVPFIEAYAVRAEKWRQRTRGAPRDAGG